MKFDINQNVWVKLNAKGLEMHRQYWEPYSDGNYRQPRTSYDGWSKFQLHEVMSVFGSALVTNANLPFDDMNIILDPDVPVIIEQEGGE